MQTTPLFWLIVKQAFRNSLMQ
nr:unnamed protein product [Callosobruchus chinensis]